MFVFHSFLTWTTSYIFINIKCITTLNDFLIHLNDIFKYIVWVHSLNYPCRKYRIFIFKLLFYRELCLSYVLQSTDDSVWFVYSLLKLFKTFYQHFYNILSTFLQHFVNIFTTFLQHFVNIFTFCQHFYNILWTFLQHFVSILTYTYDLFRL